MNSNNEKAKSRSIIVRFVNYSKGMKFGIAKLTLKQTEQPTY